MKTIITIFPVPSEALYLGDDSRFQTKRQPHWKSPSKEKSNVPDTGQVQHSKLTLQQQQKNLLLAIGKTFGIGETEYEKWYLVTTRQFLNKGGYPLINSLGPTLSNVLANLLPEHPWDSGKFVTFVKKPHDYWKSPERQREYLLELGKKLGIKEVTPLSILSKRKIISFHYHIYAHTELFHPLFLASLNVSSLQFILGLGRLSSLVQSDESRSPQ